MAVFKCKMCGGSLEPIAGASIIECEYCGTRQTLPRLDDDRRINLYDRANHFRRANEFDKASSIYEQILNDDAKDAEAYWSLVLCRYGVEYVEDSRTNKRVPTVNRTQFTSIFDDKNYKAALEYADAEQRQLYMEEAQAINDIQKKILAISQKEDPFDIFICYKETDSAGARTPDSVLAHEMYNELTREGFRVFFSRITLEDKLGSAYEPYIYAALNSAKVMIVVGTKAEHFNAVWVKNEWSRYLALINNGAKKTLIPAYKDMDPYDLPDAFSHLQALDMSKLGFMQDLVRGVRKIVGNNGSSSTSVSTDKAVSNTPSSSTESLLKRAFIFLEDQNWSSANEYCERVLDIDPENGEAYLGKLLADLHIRSKNELTDYFAIIEHNENYHRALRFGNDSLKTLLTEQNTNACYQTALKLMDTQKFEDAIKLFESIPGHQDSDELVERCREQALVSKAANCISGWKYKKAIKELKTARSLAQTPSQHKIIDTLEAQAVSQLRAMRKRIRRVAAISILIAAIALTIKAAPDIIFEIKNEIESATYNRHEAENTTQWLREALADGVPIDHIDLDNGSAPPPYALRKDGTVFTKLTNTEVSSWNNIVEISVADHDIVGLKTDGTVVASGFEYSEEHDVSSWNNITAISTSSSHTVGLRSDGTVVATGDNDRNQCNVNNWSSIKAIYSTEGCTVGLKEDGTVITTSYYERIDIGGGMYNVHSSGWGDALDGWADLTAIHLDEDTIYGITSDGRVYVEGEGETIQQNIGHWRDIVSLAISHSHAVGLKTDGTVVAAGNPSDGRCKVEDWSDIVAIAVGHSRTVGLKSDGTVVATGSNLYSECDVGNWKNIIKIFVGRDVTYGITKDGNVVSTGGRYSVWDHIVYEAQSIFRYWAKELS